MCYLDDGEIAELTADHLWVYDAYLRPIEKERCHVDWEISAAEKGGYEHFMAKEIICLLYTSHTEHRFSRSKGGSGHAGKGRDLRCQHI